MTTFPALIPSTRTYSPGEFPHSVHGVYDGSEARVRHSNTVLGVRLRLFFPALTTAELLTVIAHYNGQRGRFLPFVIPVELLSGVDTPADFTPAGHQWRYATKPTVEDISITGPSSSNVHNLTVELETVVPENTIVQGARLRVRTALQPGSPQRGEFFDVQATLTAGSAAAQVDFLVPITFEPGSPFPVVTLDVVATLEAGAFVPPALGELLATATLSAGAADSGTDPDFASVSLLLPMNGTNGSTSFPDESNNAFTVTAFNGAQISTAVSKWNGSSGFFDGANDYCTVPGNAAFNFPGDFSVQGWVNLPEVRNGFDRTMVEVGTFSNGVLIRTDATGTDTVYVNNTNMGDINSFWVVDTWQWVSLTRAGSAVEFAIDGTVRLTATISGTVNSTSGGVSIGRFSGSGGIQYFRGYQQDLRITKGVARPHAVPTAALPTS